VSKFGKIAKAQQYPTPLFSQEMLCLLVHLQCLLIFGNQKMTFVRHFPVHQTTSQYASMGMVSHLTLGRTLHYLLLEFALRRLVVDPTLTWLLTLMGPAKPFSPEKMGKYGWLMFLIMECKTVCKLMRRAHFLISRHKVTSVRTLDLWV
jgi:hypothetical protein